MKEVKHMVAGWFGGLVVFRRVSASRMQSDNGSLYVETAVYAVSSVWLPNVCVVLWLGVQRVKVGFRIGRWRELAKKNRVSFV